MGRRIESYLGKIADSLLNDDPFKNWTYNRSVEEDLDEPIISYVFEGHGVELNCDADGRISSIFLWWDGHFGLNESLEVPFSWNSPQVREHFGSPSKSGSQGSAAWDRFTMPDFTIHFTYKVDMNGIDIITFMRNDVVP